MKKLGIVAAMVSVGVVAGCGGGSSAGSTPTATTHTTHAAHTHEATVTIRTNQTISEHDLATYYRQRGQTASEAAKDSSGTLAACTKMGSGQPVTTATAPFASLDGPRANLIGDTIMKLCPAKVAGVSLFGDGETYDTMPAVPTRIAKIVQGMLNS